MDYELAKELKDAGFPQSHEECKYECYHHVSSLESSALAFTPTLSELIEACGEGEFCLTHYESQKAGWIWQADKNPFMNAEAPEQKNGNGPTPLIAVARLWLALHT